MIRHWTLPAFLATALSAGLCRAGDLPQWDFRQPDVAARWRALHDVGEMERIDGGLQIPITGPDPYCVGPEQDFPAGQRLLLKLRLRSTSGGTGQVFYFTRNATEEHSVRFAVPGGRWWDVAVPVPALGPGHRLRFDPPGTEGSCLVERLWFEPLVTVAPPDWPRPTVPQHDARSLKLATAGLELRQVPSEWGGFTLYWQGDAVACGINRQLIGYLHDGQPRWLDIHALGTVTAERQDGAIVVAARIVDPDGAEWRLSQRMTMERGALQVAADCTVTQPRQLLFLPLLLIAPGMGTHGKEKNQALFAGLEYLENEPSSSTADVETSAALRHVPDALKVTFPLMVVQAEQHYVALSWDMNRDGTPLFDSPDRRFGTNAHVLGLIAPGSEPHLRSDGELLPFAPPEIGPEQPISARAAVLAGDGSTVVPAIQHYVERHGLPPLPSTPGPAAFVEQTAAAWLDTDIRDGARFRHAAGGASFSPRPAADAAWQLHWLSTLTEQPGLRERMQGTARDALELVAPETYYDSAVGHIRSPVAPLVFGHLAEALAGARERSRQLMRRFEPDGGLKYRRQPGRADFGRTHFSDEANGFAATAVAQALEAACFAGDPTAIADSLRLLQALRRFDDGVPRGAQTWEIPLHTPDILASAYLVRAFVRGYQLTGDPDLLARARYWAWTGVPFVYLRAPTSEPVGVYATIAVLGATNWIAPVWMGLPVQWCGLVYADALRQLAPYDPAGPWLTLADGIALSGVQQVYPPDHRRQGLLPDSFSLRSQQRNPADINPATLTPVALPALGVPAPYEFLALRSANLLVHAPGSIREVSESPSATSFHVLSWYSQEFSVIIHGSRTPPAVRINGQPAAGDERLRHLPDPGTLILRLRGPAKIEISR